MQGKGRRTKEREIKKKTSAKGKRLGSLPAKAVGSKTAKKIKGGESITFG